MKKINCILLVDDNPADNYYNRFIINELDVCNHIQIAVNGLEALEYLRKTADQHQTGSFPKPDIIFLDINMPRMSGFEFLEEYKKLDQELKSTIIIAMLVTSSNPDDRVKALQIREVKEYLYKPLTSEAIYKLLDNYFYAAPLSVPSCL